MTEKDQQEKMAAERQVELFTKRLGKPRKIMAFGWTTTAAKLLDSTRSICRYQPSMPSS